MSSAAETAAKPNGGVSPETAPKERSCPRRYGLCLRFPFGPPPPARLCAQELHFSRTTNSPVTGDAVLLAQEFLFQAHHVQLGLGRHFANVVGMMRVAAGIDSAGADSGPRAPA